MGAVTYDGAVTDKGQPDWRGRILIVVLAATVLLLGYRVIKGLFTSEEDRIRGLLDTMADEAEDRAVLDFVSHLTADFTIQPDGWGKHELKRVLFVYFRRIDGPISVALREIEVAIDGDRATATLQAGLAEGGALAAGIRPDRAFSLRCRLVKEDGEWKVDRVEKEPIDW